MNVSSIGAEIGAIAGSITDRPLPFRQALRCQDGQSVIPLPGRAFPPEVGAYEQ
jgi:hypothetical protein